MKHHEDFLVTLSRALLEGSDASQVVRLQAMDVISSIQLLVDELGTAPESRKNNELLVSLVEAIFTLILRTSPAAVKQRGQS